jgi:hypothetical protein
MGLIRIERTEQLRNQSHAFGFQVLQRQGDGAQLWGCPSCYSFTNESLRLPVLGGQFAVGLPDANRIRLLVVLAQGFLLAFWASRRAAASAIANRLAQCEYLRRQAFGLKARRLLPGLSAGVRLSPDRCTF